MKILDLLASLHNWLCDKDFIWWPFSFLRPETNVPMSHKMVLTMALCFGCLAYTMFTVFAVMNGMFTLESTFLTLVGSFLGFYLWFALVTKPLWNHRTRQLQGK